MSSLTRIFHCKGDLICKVGIWYLSLYSRNRLGEIVRGNTGATPTRYNVKPYVYSALEGSPVWANGLCAHEVSEKDFAS